MAWIALVRHGVTEWNERNLIQGRTDTSLSANGIAKLQQARPCDDFLQARWVTSPLQRAVQTAAILNPHGLNSHSKTQHETDPLLIETKWGALEGVYRADLPKRIRELALVPDHGLDFCPPGGESARMVRQRLVNWCTAAAETGTAAVAVTHKGVIRSALSAACNWDMEEEYRPKPNWSLPHIFAVDAGGALRLVRLNCGWDESPDSYMGSA